MNIKNYQKKYNDLVKQFRENFNNRDISLELFDLLYALQSIEQTKENKALQSNIYAVLEYWKTAYRLLLESVDTENSKIQSKLFVFSEKARTYKDTFGLKDIRQSRQKKDAPIINLDDFVRKGDLSTIYGMDNVNLIVFNKYCPIDKFNIHASSVLSSIDKVELIEHMHWLSDTREQLIEFYNSHSNAYLPFMEERADDDWYDTLDVYSTTIRYRGIGEIETTVSVGDQYIKDHIIDLVFNNKECCEMHFDG